MAEQAIFGRGTLRLARGQDAAILCQLPLPVGILDREAQAGVIDRGVADQTVDAGFVFGRHLVGRLGQAAVANVAAAAAAGDVELLVENAQPVDAGDARGQRGVVIHLLGPRVVDAVHHIAGHVAVAGLASGGALVLLDILMRLGRLGQGDGWGACQGKQQT